MGKKKSARIVKGESRKIIQSYLHGTRVVVDLYNGMEGETNKGMLNFEKITLDRRKYHILQLL